VSEYLSEEEQIARMKSWWDENGMGLIISVVVAVAAIVGWRWYDGYTEEQSFEASRAYAAFQQADSAERAQAALVLAQEHAGSAYHVFALFGQAQDALGERDLQAAEGYLAQVIQVGDDALLQDLAKVRLAKVQQSLDRSSEALQTLASISNEGYRAWGLETKGDIHVARGELELAHAAYQAALETLDEGDQRPILEMKLNNVAPFDGEYVQFADTLESALKEAQETLDEAAAQDMPTSEDAATIRDEVSDEAEHE